MSAKGETNIYKPTEAECRLLVSCFRNINENINEKIDFDQVARDTGYKSAIIARTLFNRLRKSVNDTASSPKVKTEKAPKAAGKRKATAQGDGPPKKRGRKPSTKLPAANVGNDDEADDEELIIKPEEAILLDDDLKDETDSEDITTPFHNGVKLEPMAIDSFGVISNPFFKKEAVEVAE